MKCRTIIAGFCILLIIGMTIGCNRKEPVDPSQKFVQEQFPKDQDKSCELLFDSAEQLGKILSIDNCEGLAKALDAAPKDLIDNYEKGLMECRLMYMTRSEANTYAQTAPSERTNQIMATARVDKLFFENACSKTEGAVFPVVYQRFEERRAITYHNYFRKKA